MQSKNYRNKVKTLCTIDTSDIELQDPRLSTNLITPAIQNKREKIGESPCLRKTSQQKVWTPAGHGRNYDLFKTKYEKAKSPTSKNKSRTKSLLNNTVHSKSKSKSRVKTEYSIVSEIAIKSFINKSCKTTKNKLMNPFEESYKMDTFEIVEETGTKINGNGKEKEFIVTKGDRLYLMKKTKDQEIKRLYENEMCAKEKLGHIKWNNLVKIVKIYQDKSWTYAVYEFHGDCLNWSNASHCQVISKILQGSGTALKHIIKETSKALQELSAQGYTHSNVRLENICMKIQELKKSIKVDGSVRLSNLQHSFHIKNKSKLVSMSDSIYTPPEIINLKLYEHYEHRFEKGERFDRQLIELIEYYDQGWYVDMWALGILALELIAGESISIQKEGTRNQIDNEISLEIEDSSRKSDLTIDLKKSDITLWDILEAQKSLLGQVESQICKISFDPKLQKLIFRMLSVNPFDRPSPKEIIKSI